MPAPSRYVVDLPGSPGVDAIDGTAFGPWTQPDDQTADLVTITSSTVEPVTGGASIDGTENVDDPDDVGPENPNEETSALAASLSRAGDFGAPVDEGGMLSVYHLSWTEVTNDPDGSDDDPIQFEHGLEGARSAAGASLACSAQDLQWREGWLPGAPPAGAIGYEIEQAELPPGLWAPVAEPLSLHLVLTFAPTVIFGSAAGQAIAVLNSQWGDGPVEFSYAGSLLDLTLLRRAPSTLAAADDASIQGPFAVDLPLPVLGPPVVTVMEGEVDISSAPPYTGLIALHQTVKTTGDVSVDDGETLKARSNVSASGVYTIRPPRFRWIYATPPTTPYRRIFPRDDALAGGAGRNWPPSKAYQSGIRTAGGYL